MGCGLIEATVFSLGLITGTGTTITGKVLYGLRAPGIDGVVRPFEKPILQTWGMFVAMVFALPIHYAYQWYVHRGKATPAPKTPAKIFWILIFPSIFDLIGTVLQNLGLLYIAVSTFQLMKCTVIIFVALLKVLVLKHKLRPYMWFGIFLNTVAVVLVGLTSFLDNSIHTGAEANASGNPLLGITFVVLSCLVQSGQYVFEEFVMTDGGGAPPLVVVGMEGFWGLVLTTFVVFPTAYMLPGSDHGSMERFDEGWAQLRNRKSSFVPLVWTGTLVYYVLTKGISSQRLSTTLYILILSRYRYVGLLSAIQGIFAIYVLVILGFNIFAVLTTYLLDSVWHAILDNFRPISVWGFDLALFYFFTAGSFGEPWTVWSWLQMAGMVVLLYGTAVYNGSVLLPYFDYGLLEEEKGVIRTPLDQASTSMTRSPLINRNALKAQEVLSRTPLRQQKKVKESYLTEYHDPHEEGIRRGGYGTFEQGRHTP